MKPLDDFAACRRLAGLWLLSLLLLGGEARANDLPIVTSPPPGCGTG